MEPHSLKPFLQKALSRTRPVQTNPAASVEVHTVLCHSDIYYYLVSIKSLLRFFDDLRVVVHDDGSLTEEDVSLLRSHIHDLQVLARQEMDVRVADRLAGKFRTLEARRTRPILMQVIDYFVSAKTDKIISLDSDTLFFGLPQELVEWINSEGELARYNYEAGAGLQLQDASGTCFHADNRFPFPLLEGINGGLVCCPRAVADFDFLERYLSHLQATVGLSPGQYIFAQNIFGLYLRNSACIPKPFNGKDYKVLCHYTAMGLPEQFRGPAVFKHYNLREQRFNRIYQYQEDICGVIDELIQVSPT